MQVKSEKENKLTQELKVVPFWAWMLAAVGFLSAQVFFNLVMDRQADAPPAAARVALGMMAGIVLGVYLLFLGYVNRDARRRGMSPLLWTSVAILIPNGLGILLYFILRTPRRNSCPQCGKPVQVDFDFCPSCSYRMSARCPHCERTVGGDVVGTDASYCPYCGSSLRGEAVSASESSAKLSV